MTHGAYNHNHPHGHEPKGPWWKQVHRDWRVWTGIVLMILALAAYVLSMDESLRPGGGVKTPVSAAP